MGFSHLPDMMFFLVNPSIGESITVIGIAIGVSYGARNFSVCLFLEEIRNPVFAFLAVLAGLLTCVAISGIVF